MAWQLRLDNPDDDNKYLWAAGARSRTPRPTSHLQNGELPLAVYKPSIVKKTGVVGLTEGIGFKPHIASERLGITIIGAAGGNFASSPQTLSAYLQSRTLVEVIFYPDAGVLVNKQVFNTCVKTIELIESWGYQVKVAWWQQFEKSVGDIDEISDEQIEAIEYLSPQQFYKLSDFPQPEFDSLTNSEEPDPIAYQQYIEWEKEQKKIEEAIAQENFTTWLKGTLKGFSQHFKGFVTEDFAKTEVKELPETISSRSSPVIL